jgi:hypothetical protein
MNNKRKMKKKKELKAFPLRSDTGKDIRYQCPFGKVL